MFSWWQLFDVFGRSGRPKCISGSPLGRDREMYRAPWVPPGGPSGFRHLPQEGPKTPQGANLTSQSTPGATLSAPQGSQDTPRAPKSNSGTQNDLKMMARGPKIHVFGTLILMFVDVNIKTSDIKFYDLGPQSSHVWRFRPRWMCTTNPIQTLHEPVHPFMSSDYPEKLEKFEKRKSRESCPVQKGRFSLIDGTGTQTSSNQSSL